MRALAASPRYSPARAAWEKSDVGNCAQNG